MKNHCLLVKVWVSLQKNPSQITQFVIFLSRAFKLAGKFFRDMILKIFPASLKGQLKKIT